MRKLVHHSFSLALLPTLVSPLYAAEADLADVVVTASGFKQQAKNAAASITVINAKELETKEYHDVTDALQDVPGVVITRLVICMKKILFSIRKLSFACIGIR